MGSGQFHALDGFPESGERCENNDRMVRSILTFPDEGWIHVKGAENMRWNRVVGVGLLPGDRSERLGAKAWPRPFLPSGRKRSGRTSRIS
jgi:hypothetical protein